MKSAVKTTLGATMRIQKSTVMLVTADSFSDGQFKSPSIYTGDGVNVPWTITAVYLVDDNGSHLAVSGSDLSPITEHNGHLVITASSSILHTSRHRSTPDHFTMKTVIILVLTSIIKILSRNSPTNK